MIAPALLVSIHDVMPATLPRVADLLAWLADRGVDRTTLLVVPGLEWDGRSIHRLRRWQSEGHRLAAHGWVHRVERPRGPGGRLHSWLISRDCGEHLGLDGAGVEALIRRSQGWFLHHGLGSPELYVPPAWALGPLPRARRARLPFSLLETLAGVHRLRGRRFEPLPLLGYEADTRGRAAGVRAWNAVNEAWGRRRGLLRLTIHPRDRELLLARDLERRLERVGPCLDYRNL